MFWLVPLTVVDYTTKKTFIQAMNCMKVEGLKKFVDLQFETVYFFHCIF
jgi:hypothetical protein